MILDKQLKEVIIDQHVDNLLQMNLSEEEEVEETKALKEGIKTANAFEEGEIAKERLNLEKEKFSEEVKQRAKNFKLEKEKFEQSKKEFEENKAFRENELKYKEKMLDFECYKFDKEFELRREESKRNVVVQIAVGVISNIFGVGKTVFLAHKAHKEWKMSRVMEYHDMGRETPSMKESNKIINDLTNKK